MNATTRWHLLRHAPAAVAKGTIYGHMDVAAEAQDPALLARIVERLPVGALLVTTGLRRSDDTARMLVSAGWEVAEETVETRFREQDFGAWEGQTHAALAETSGTAYAGFWEDPARNRPPGGESFADLLERAGAALRDLTAAHRGREIVLIGHGGSIRAALATALQISADSALAIDLAPLSLSLADHVPGEGPLPPWRLRGINLPPGT